MTLLNCLVRRVPAAFVGNHHQSLLCGNLQMRCTGDTLYNSLSSVADVVECNSSMSCRISFCSFIGLPLTSPDKPVLHENSTLSVVFQENKPIRRL
jgi:hypothetical protein